MFAMIESRSKMALAIAITATMLVGCTDRVSLVDAKMAEIRSKPAQPIEPPPEPQPIEDYIYAAKDMRSPFVPMSVLEAQTRAKEMPAIKPDENRIKEALEDYELSQLVYRGKVIAPNGQAYGLVQTPDGMVHDVQVGNYMGRNHGRIVEITSTQINLIEIVEDLRLGYVEQVANVTSPN